MGPWVSKSRPGMQLFLAIGALVVGALLMWATRGLLSAGENERAGFGLGVLVTLLGAGGVATVGFQTVTIDPRYRRIDIADLTILGPKNTTITFAQVTRVSIGYLGKSSNFVQTYYLVLHLTDGREYPLFAPGRYFAGASSRLVVEGWRDRLEGYLRAGVA
jgi:hypothetical protein